MCGHRPGEHLPFLAGPRYRPQGTPVPPVHWPVTTSGRAEGRGPAVLLPPFPGTCWGRSVDPALWTQASWQSGLTLLQRSECRPISDPDLCAPRPQWSKVRNGPQPATPTPGGGERFGDRNQHSAAGTVGWQEQEFMGGPWRRPVGTAIAVGVDTGPGRTSGVSVLKESEGGFGRVEAGPAEAEWHRGSGSGKGRAGQASLPTDPS